MALCFDTQKNKALQSVPKKQAVEKAGSNNNKGKAHHNSGKYCSWQGGLQPSHNGFCSPGHGCGYSGHGQGG
jgi:hypothetical protein